jgi:ADP-ribosylglycohydrolase
MVNRFENRVAGGVIGSAVGDAIGAPCECLDYRDIRKALGDYQGIEQILNMQAQSHTMNDWWTPEMAWNVTDDSVLSDLLLDCIIKHDGQISAYEFAKEWELLDQPVPNPNGGEVVRLSCLHFIEQIPFLRNKLAIYKRDLGRGEYNATNAIMYIAPVGLLCAGDPLAAELMAIDITSVNEHGRPRDVAGGYCAGLAACFIKGKTVEEIIGICVDHTRDFLCLKEIHAMLALAATCASCDEYIERYYQEIIGPIIPYTDLQHEIFCPGLCVSWRSSEILGNALAFFLITQGNDARAMILAAAKIGRDADTIARVAGGLIGTYRGIDAIPADWVAQVTRKNAWMQLEEKTARLSEIIRRKLQTRIDSAQSIMEAQ